MKNCCHFNAGHVHLVNERKGKLYAARACYTCVTDLTRLTAGALQRLALLKLSNVAQKLSEDQQRAVSSDSAAIWLGLDVIYWNMWVNITKRQKNLSRPWAIRYIA